MFTFKNYNWTDFYILTHFQPMFYFFTTIPNRKPEVSDVFRGYRNGTLVENRLKELENTWKAGDA